jgi:hypothetical protein
MKKHIGYLFWKDKKPQKLPLCVAKARNPNIESYELVSIEGYRFNDETFCKNCKKVFIGKGE